LDETAVQFTALPPEAVFVTTREACAPKDRDPPLLPDKTRTGFTTGTVEKVDDVTLAPDVGQFTVTAAKYGAKSEDELAAATTVTSAKSPFNMFENVLGVTEK
jgi:hypothetical protein